MVALSNVSTNDTFDVWRVRTNQIIYRIEELGSAGASAYDRANTANYYAYLVDANTSAAYGAANSANAVVTANVNYVNTAMQFIFAKVNAAYDATNTSNSVAIANVNYVNTAMQAAFAKANTGDETGSAAFDEANTAYDYAYYVDVNSQAAFGAANVANIRAVAAFAKANDSSITIVSDTVNTSRYVAFINATSGKASTLNVSTSGLLFNPDSRTLTTTNFIAETTATVGSATPGSYPLDVVGASRISNSLGVGTTPSGVTGSIRATENITAYFSSDMRLKRNITEIQNALEKLHQIRGVNFDWSDEYLKEQGGEDGYFVRKHDIGVIAQEIEKVLPEVVATRDDGIKAVKYEKIIALLIEAIKELDKKIESK